MTKPKTLPKRTRGDLLHRLHEAIGGAFLREKFEREVMPQLVLGPQWTETLSEQEYQQSLKRMRAELPAFVNYLRHYQGPPCPDSWVASQS